MSSQTIIPNKLENLLDKVDEFYICQANKYMYKLNYGLGDGEDITKFLTVEWLDRIVTSNICINNQYEKILEELNLILLK